MFDKTKNQDQATNPGAATAKPAANTGANSQQAPRLPAYVMHG
jgi:hypothetical protein